MSTTSPKRRAKTKSSDWASRSWRVRAAEDRDSRIPHCSRLVREWAETAGAKAVTAEVRADPHMLDFLTPDDRRAVLAVLGQTIIVFRGRDLDAAKIPALIDGPLPPLSTPPDRVSALIADLTDLIAAIDETAERGASDVLRRARAAAARRCVALARGLTVTPLEDEMPPMPAKMSAPPPAGGQSPPAPPAYHADLRVRPLGIKPLGSPRPAEAPSPRPPSSGGLRPPEPPARSQAPDIDAARDIVVSRLVSLCREQPTGEPQTQTDIPPSPPSPAPPHLTAQEAPTAAVSPPPAPTRKAVDPRFAGWDPVHVRRYKRATRVPFRVKYKWHLEFYPRLAGIIAGLLGLWYLLG